MKVDQGKLAKQLRHQADRMADDISDLEHQWWEEFDFKEAFARILGMEEDWTDKLARGIGKIQRAFLRPERDTELPAELRFLIPDMKKVAAAYSEMTEGYKEFIRTVCEAQNNRRATLGK